MKRRVPADAQAAAKRIFRAAVIAARKEGLEVDLLVTRDDFATYAYSPHDDDTVLGLLLSLVDRHRPADVTLTVAIEDEEPPS